MPVRHENGKTAGNADKPGVVSFLLGPAAAKIPHVPDGSAKGFANVIHVHGDKASKVLDFVVEARTPHQVISDVLVVEVPASVDVAALAAATAVLVRQMTAGAEVRDVIETAPSLPPALLAAIGEREAQLRGIQERYGLLSSAQVGELAGSTARNRSEYATSLRRDGKVLAVRRQGGYLFPGFQFTPHRGVYPVMPRLIRLLGEQGWDPVSILLWMDSPNGYLAGATPIDRISDEDAVLDAAANAADAGR
jgi:hypothetical protein